ncbi:short-chain dehydrogenase reductase [Fusarium pseudocircinatum]|uniref:Short-chain dehydrogenase reductase n=1 Tax=Fusarium pseudocircinatum TaxID=56676 RepID=A0A8H5P812_9HYPO|nr:short-chain dehydrogenase reductase [Fusarium pseudocircinatum]
MSQFCSDDIPDLSGQVIIVTGGNAGLGYETIRQLGRHNPARIYLGARSQKKAEKAVSDLRQDNPKICPIKLLEIDLASFESIKAAASMFLSQETRLDILINNAGIMMVPEGLTKDGYEIQFGTNVLGTALLTQLLLPILRSTVRVNPQTRVVVVCSAAHARAPKDAYDNFQEFQTTAAHRHTTARYTISKLADIHFAKALSERVQDLKIIPVHPGMVATNLHDASTGFFLKPFLNIAIGLFATPPEKGALSQIWASVSSDAKSGEYYGPVGKAEAGSNLAQNHGLQEKVFHYIQTQLKGHVETLS